MKKRQNISNYKKKAAAIFLAALCMISAGCANPVEDGRKLLEEGKFSEAQAEFEKAVDGKNAGEAFRGIGLCYWEQQEYEKAADAFGKALDNGSEETAVIYNLLGLCAMEMDQPEKAVYYFEHGQNFSDAGQELLKEMSFNLVAAYEQVGDYQAAREKLEIYVSLYPDDQEAAKELEFLQTQAPGGDRPAE